MRRAHVKAVLCGDTNMLRCFDGTGIPTALVAFDHDNMALYSRQTREKHVIASPRLDPDQCLEGLLALGSTLVDRPVLYYGDDAALLLVSRHREILARHYRFLMPDADCIEALANKLQFAQLARRLDLPAPRTMLAGEINDLQEVETKLSLPCILKPNSHVGWFTSEPVMAEGGRPQKVLRASTRGDLRRLHDRMKDYTHDFLIQEYVPGGDDCIYSFHAYLNARSEPLAHYVGRKIRTYPKHSGVSTYLQLVHEPELVRLGLEILQKLRFVGVAKLDFKRDPVRQRFLLLEINPRFCLWNHLGAACGINLPMVAYRDLVGESVPPQTEYRTDVRWLSFGDDLRAFIREYWRDGDLSVLQYLSSLRGRKVYDVFSWKDPKPWIMSMVHAAHRFMLKLTGRPAQRALVPAPIAEPAGLSVPQDQVLAKGVSR